MADETGEDLGEEFNTIVERLERGEDPESIEADLALPEDALDEEGESEGSAEPESARPASEAAESPVSTASALGDE
jgi:hypothetical protein